MSLSVGLNDILFNQRAQIDVALELRQTFKDITIDDIRGSNCVMGQKSEQKQKKRQRAYTLGEILKAGRQSDNTTSTIKAQLAQIDGFYHWISQGQAPIMSTWAMLIGLYVCEDLKRLVSRYTHPAIAAEYLNEFDSRFETHLFGVLEHERRSKRTVIKRQAKSPVEIVLYEWMLCSKLVLLHNE